MNSNLLKILLRLVLELLFPGIAYRKIQSQVYAINHLVDLVKTIIVMCRDYRPSIVISLVVNVRIVLSQNFFICTKNSNNLER